MPSIQAKTRQKKLERNLKDLKFETIPRNPVLSDRPGNAMHHCGLRTIKDGGKKSH